MNNKVLFIDDEKHVRIARKQTLELAGYDVLCCESAKEGLNYISPDWEGILISDIKMPGMDGMSLLQEAMDIDPDLPVVLVTGHADVAMAVKAMQIGAYDFIEKPCPTDLFLDIVKRASEKRKLVLENRNLSRELERQKNSGFNIIGKSPAMDRLKQIIKNVSDAQADVLILGETGTGKELVAKCIHDMSPRRNKRFVALNCGALPESLIESELFGHEAGAFTGASQMHKGKFEFADGGAIFLDEIESMPLQLQVKLLRVLQERTVERLGSNESIPIDIRVIAAAKVDLKEACDRNQFRQDLYYRLNVVNIELPPLRDRKEDIPLLFNHFVLTASARYKKPPVEISPEFMRELIGRNWEGNVRELKNEAERHVLGLSALYPLNRDHQGSQTPGNSQNLASQVCAFEKAAILEELIRNQGDIKKTYTALDLPRQTFYDKLNKYGLKRSDYT